MTLPTRLTINGVTYCLGTAGSFIRVCSVCGHERFRGKPDNPLEHCWDGHGPLDVLTTDNLERYKAFWARVDNGEATFLTGRKKVMTNLRSFAFGALFGAAAFIASLIVVSMMAGVKWQPVAAAWF